MIDIKKKKKKEQKTLCGAIGDLPLRFHDEDNDHFHHKVMAQF